MRVLVATVALSGLLGTPLRGAPPEGNFALPALADGVKGAEKVSVYRGVPRKGEPRPWEVKGTPIEFHGTKFGPEPQPVPPAEVKELADLFAAKSFKAFPEGVSRCLGFHPDYVLEWAAKDRVYRVLFCFNCNEIKVFKFPAGDEKAAELEAHWKVDASGDKSPREAYRKLMAGHFPRK